MEYTFPLIIVQQSLELLWAATFAVVQDPPLPQAAAGALTVRLTDFELDPALLEQASE